MATTRTGRKEPESRRQPTDESLTGPAFAPGREEWTHWELERGARPKTCYATAFIRAAYAYGDPSYPLTDWQLSPDGNQRRLDLIRDWIRVLRRGCPLSLLQLPAGYFVKGSGWGLDQTKKRLDALAQDEEISLVVGYDNIAVPPPLEGEYDRPRQYVLFAQPGSRCQHVEKEWFVRDRGGSLVLVPGNTRVWTWGQRQVAGAVCFDLEGLSRESVPKLKSQVEILFNPRHVNTRSAVPTKMGNRLHQTLETVARRYGCSVCTSMLFRDVSEQSRARLFAVQARPLGHWRPIAEPCLIDPVAERTLVWFQILPGR